MALHELMRTMRKKALLSQEDFAKELFSCFLKVRL